MTSACVVLTVCVCVEGTEPWLESGVVSGVRHAGLQAAVSDLHVCVQAKGDQRTRDSRRAGQFNTRSDQ